MLSLLLSPYLAIGEQQQERAFAADVCNPLLFAAAMDMLTSMPLPARPPPSLLIWTAAGVCAIDHLEANAAQLIPTVQESARRFRTAAATIPQLAVVGGDAAAISPVVHLALHPAPTPAEVGAAACLVPGKTVWRCRAADCQLHAHCSHAC